MQISEILNYAEVYGHEKDQFLRYIQVLDSAFLNYVFSKKKKAKVEAQEVKEENG